MIEAPEYATPTQLELYRRYRQIHCKFFPSPPPNAPLAEAIQPPPPPQPPPRPQIVRAIPFEQTHLRLKIIRRTVCKYYGITEEAVKSNRRTHDIVVPRHMISYLASQFSKASTTMIGHAVGGQDHTTIMHAIRCMRMRVQNDRAIREQAEQLKGSLRQQFGETDSPGNCIGRYVPHQRVAEYFKCGWMWAANLNEYAALMIWPCSCECVEPRE